MTGRTPEKPAVCLPGTSARSQGHGNGVCAYLCDKGEVAQVRLGHVGRPSSGVATTLSQVPECESGGCKAAGPGSTEGRASHSS